MTWYNTTKEPEKAQLDERTEKQEDLILQFFRAHAENQYTPFDIMSTVLPNAPITSVRRAMTDLTKKGYLIKTTIKKTERYGVGNYTWKLNGSARQGRLFFQF